MTRAERLAKHLQSELETKHYANVSYGTVLETIKEYLKEHSLCLTKIREIGD